MNEKGDLVYSTDPELNRRCTRCGQVILSCKCSRDSGPVDRSKISACVRLEKKNRAGKDVTVIDCLPSSEEFLKDLSTDLKRKCGSGGTYRIVENRGTVEIQGDKRDKVVAELGKQGIKCR